ncbi:MAG: ABC transporter substrate-binding protein [Betaproteobacteria bacterium]|nr:ABC transporter substrate-binding protein [Betaproteobacteria bacterium]
MIPNQALPILSALALCTCVTALAQSPFAAPSNSIEIRIGHVAPLTGGIRHLAKDNENGARLAVDQANAANIRIGGKVANFVLIGEDDRADPRVALTVAQKLVAANVAGVVGHLNSGTSIPAARIYEQAGIPVITPSATNPRLTELGSKVQFRVVGRDDEQGPAIANYLASTARPKLVAIIDDSTAYGEETANSVELTLKSNNIEVLAREKGTDRTSDWRVVLATVQDAKPDAIFYGGMDATAGPLLKQARELGIRALFLSGDGACTGEMIRLAGGAAEGMLCVQPGIPIGAAASAFVEAYKMKFNAAPILYAPFAYDATNMLIAAMKQADSADPAKYLPQLAKLSFTGATGRIAFDEKGDRNNAPMTIFTMKGGRLEPVAIITGRERLTSLTSSVPLPNLVAAAPSGAASVPTTQPGPGLPLPGADSCDSGLASRSTRFVVKGGIAVDKKTGLIWQRCSVGQRWSPNKGCEGEAREFKWTELGRLATGGWRVPTQAELIGIQSTGCEDAAIDKGVFPNTLATAYWSTTVYANREFFGFAFFGKVGGGGGGPADSGMHVRLVRDK